MPDAPRAENRFMQHRQERITFETTRHRITGTATLARDGYRSRISDLLNASEREFISLTDAVVEPLDRDGEITEHAYIAVHRRHVVFAVTHGPVAPVVPSGPTGLVA